MRSQPKRFVVEVKRGTSRAAFTSHDPAAERFGAAEQALFGAPAAPAAPAPQPAEPAARPAGRVLRSLIEPPAPAIEIPEPLRRGRKPGSKNKPKPAPVAEATPVPALAGESVAAFDPPAADTLADGPPAAEIRIEAASGRTRLRERSSILRRYVLNVEARPGEPGRLRQRRLARGAER